MQAPRLQRVGDGPSIDPGLDSRLGDNINGPSVIAAPSWIPDPIGRYWMYFSHHQGSGIRLAVADKLEGPWQIQSVSVIDMHQAGFVHHIASPDVHVFEERQQVRMYFHGCGHTGSPHQPTKAATSNDGRHFTVHHEILGSSYWRVFTHGHYYYTLEMPGVLRRSSNGLTDFEEGPTLFDESMRHSAVHRQGDVLHVFFSRVGDQPESILWTWIDLTEDWTNWILKCEPVTVLQPEMPWEGGDLEKLPSERGPAPGPVCQLRDPCIFHSNSKTFLFYTVAGESGVALARIHW